MNKTKSKFTRYWDNLISKKLPSYVQFNKVEAEVKEHFAFLTWAFKRIILPLTLFYIAAGILLKMNVLGSLVIALLIFLYSNFLPDTDFLIKATPNKQNQSKWYELYSLLFFAPVVIYYILDGRKKPLYTKKNKFFHTFKAMLFYGLFLFILGSILWQQPLKMAILPVFGMLGFAFHLMVDQKIKNIFQKKKQA